VIYKNQRYFFLDLSTKRKVSKGKNKTKEKKEGKPSFSNFLND